LAEAAVEDRMPLDLLKTAATPEASEPPASDKEQAVRDFMALLDANPGLGAAIADFIEQYLTRGGGRVATETAAPVAAGVPGVAPGVAAPATAPAPGAGAPQGGFDLQALAQRLEALESGHASLMLEREIQEARQVYDVLKKEMPFLPEFNEQEILQYVLEHNGIPVAKAVKLWAIEKALEGEGGLADRLIAERMKQRQAEMPPKPMAHAGAPAGAEQRKMPEKRTDWLREAREAFFSRFGQLAT